MSTSVRTVSEGCGELPGPVADEDPELAIAVPDHESEARHAIAEVHQ